jgi:general secretion pathway protein I
MRTRSSSAFTLIEVLFALAILGFAAVALGGAYVNVLVCYQRVSRDTQADADLRFAISQALAEPDRDKLEEGSDFEGVGGQRVRWKAELTSTTVADLFDVKITCDLYDPGQGGTVTRVQTLRVLRPTWSEDTERTKLRDDARKRIQELNGESK